MRVRNPVAVALLVAVFLAALLLGPSPARAQGPSEPGGPPAIRSAVETWLGGRFKVDDVRRSPLAGIWEVRLGSDLIYVDERGQYAFVEGAMVDLRSGRNLTRERLDEMLAINFRDLPLNLALKQVIGNGKRVVAVFEDANCGYCRTMRKDLLALKDLTIYTFPMAILSADSDLKARKALCAADRTTAWNELMLTGKVPGNAGTCEHNLGRLRELAQKLSVSATPTVFFANGRRLQGYVPADRFEKMLEENARP
jgi:thiol:disulfide interchange protein DsbC